MTLQDTLNCIKQSNVCKLIADSNVVGFRVKIYNVKWGFEYYDFDIGMIKGQGVRDFLHSIEGSMGRITLMHNNGLLVSQEELDGSIVVQNPLSSQQIEELLCRLETIRRRCGDVQSA